MPVAAPADRRFRRVHVSPARRRAWWRPTWRGVVRAGLLSVAIAYGAYRLADIVLSAEVLTVSRITVSGTARMSSGEVLALLEGLRGANLITTDLDQWRQKLLSAPWVADAAIRRVLPGTLTVHITEREPLGIARLGTRLYLLDDRGLVIDEFGPNYADLDLPIIDGLADSPNEGGLLVHEARAALVVRLLSELEARPALASRISQIVVQSARDLSVVLKGDTAVVRLGGERFAERLQSYLDLAPALRERVPQIDYVDLRFDERIYVRPGGLR